MTHAALGRSVGAALGPVVLAWDVKNPVEALGSRPGAGKESG
jgi:hypothetical protein